VSAPDHLTAVARNAHALAARGDLRGAQAMLDQALEPAAGLLGPQHPEVLAATRLLASLHRDLGDLADSRRLLEEALAAGHFALGEDAPALLPLSYDLAMLADELGNRHEARRNFTSLMRYGPAALGPDHEYVRAARRYLGVVAPAVPTGDPSGPHRPAPPVEPRPDPAASVVPGPDPAAPALPGPDPAAPALPPREAGTAAASGPTPPTVPARWSTPQPAVWSARNSESARETPSARDAESTPDTQATRDFAVPDDEHRHSRMSILALVLVAAMALAGGITAAVLVLRTPAADPAARSTPTTPSQALRPPADLRLRDDGSSVTLTWSDPSRGTVPFIVAGGRAGNALNPLGSVESGKNTYTLNGISASADFCFLVAAVYSPEHTVPSSLICTKRVGPSPSPGR
jgi:hypothetical protein